MKKDCGRCIEPPRDSIHESSSPSRDWNSNSDSMLDDFETLLEAAERVTKPFDSE